MLATTRSPTLDATDWLASFSQALANADGAALGQLFRDESHWRDVLALTWDIRTVSGLDAVVDGLVANAARANPKHWLIDARRTPPREVIRAGAKCIETIFRFETAVGRGSGVLR